MNIPKLSSSAAAGAAFVIVGLSGAHALAQNGEVAVAVLEPTEGNAVAGTVRFIEQAHSTKIEIDLAGLEPGRHGIHLHEFGNCSAPDASSAGGHFSPRNEPHGAPADEPEERHAGDLGNIVAGKDGRVTTEKFSEKLEFYGSFDVIGRAVIVHADSDDFESQPSGDAGPRVACGVIEAA